MLVAVLTLSTNLHAQAPQKCTTMHIACESYASQDLSVLQEIIELNQLSLSPQDLGQQVWDNGRLTWFALGGDGITIHALPESLGQLDGLTHLYLSGNHLKTLPQSIGQLVGLEALYLNDNALEVLPESMGQLTRLEQLYLNGNRLTTIPASLANLAALRNLYLNDNQIASIPEAVAHLPALRNLYF